jgi:hypothetical protein
VLADAIALVSELCGSAGAQPCVLPGPT